MDEKMNKEEVRSEVEKLLHEQLVGPREPEDVLPAEPSNVYLTGILWPREAEVGADEDDAGRARVAAS